MLDPVFKEVLPTKKKQELILENCTDAGKPSFAPFPFSINLPSFLSSLLHFQKFERAKTCLKDKLRNLL